MASTAWGSQLYYKRRRVFRTRRTMCTSASFANTVIESRRGCGVAVSFPEKGSARPAAVDERVTRHNAETSDQRRR